MITKHELDVLEHTSRTGRYVTSEASVRGMAQRGLLHDHGGTGFWPEGTRGYTMAAAGRALLHEHYTNLCRFPEPKKKRPPSPAFEAWRNYCDACQHTPFVTFWKEIWPNRRNALWS